MDAALNGLAYFTESVATPEQLLEFVSHCGEDPTELDEDSLLEAVKYYVSEDSYRGLAALTAIWADRTPGGIPRKYSADARVARGLDEILQHANMSSQTYVRHYMRQIRRVAVARTGG